MKKKHTAGGSEFHIHLFRLILFSMRYAFLPQAFIIHIVPIYFRKYNFYRVCMKRCHSI